jgi:hypothetical protein
MTVLARQDTGRITVTIDGRDFGVFESKTGGSGDSEETKVRLGSMGPQVSLGGPQTMENVTLKKLFDLDGIGREVPWLMARRGKATAVVTVQPLDHDGNAHGQRTTYTGYLKQVTPPDVDAQSNDPAYLELEISTHGVVA